MTIKAQINIDPKLLAKIPDMEQALNKMVLGRRAEILTEQFLIQMGFLEPSLYNLLMVAWLKKLDAKPDVS